MTIARNEEKLSFMDCVSAAHTVIRATEDVTGTVVESDYEDTNQKSHRPSKTVIKSSSDTRLR